MSPRTRGLTVDELSRVVEEVGHEDPVNDHGSDEGHHGEDQAGPLAKLAKVEPANIREFPVGRVHISWAGKNRDIEDNRTITVSFWRRGTNVVNTATPVTFSIT